MRSILAAIAASLITRSLIWRALTVGSWIASAICPTTSGSEGTLCRRSTSSPSEARVIIAARSGDLQELAGVLDLGVDRGEDLHQRALVEAELLPHLRLERRLVAVAGDAD